VNYVGDILLYVPCMLYCLLSRQTNAHYLYTNNILYIVGTATRSDVSASSTGRLNNVRVL
jgi:hypothetical protein